MSRQEGHVLGLSCHLKRIWHQIKTLTGCPERSPRHHSTGQPLVSTAQQAETSSIKVLQQPWKLSPHPATQRGKPCGLAYRCEEGRENCSPNSAASGRQRVLNVGAMPRCTSWHASDRYEFFLSPFCIKQENGSVGLTVSS